MLLQFHLQYFLSSQKIYELWGSVQILLLKKLLKKQHDHRRNYTSKFFIFRYLLNFTTECIGSQIKASRFLSCIICEAKSTKGEECNIRSDCETTCKKRTDSWPCLHAVEKYEKVESINTQNDYKTMSKKWTDKKKTNLCLNCLNKKCLNSKITKSKLLKKISRK